MTDNHTLPDACTQQTSAAQTIAERWTNAVLTVLDRHQIRGLVHTSCNGSARVDVECADLAQAWDLAITLAGNAAIGVHRDHNILGDITTLVITATPVTVRWASSLATIPYARGGRRAGHPAPATTIQPTGEML
jgi:hypothetical protein